MGGFFHVRKESFFQLEKTMEKTMVFSTPWKIAANPDAGYLLDYLVYYHTKRPHMGLNMKTPNQFLKDLVPDI